MEYPTTDYYGNPVVIVGRPGRNRPRHASEHHNRYVQDANGYLIPALGPGSGAPHRSYSASGQRPASIIINNSQYDDYSPERSPRSARHKNHHHHSYDSSDSWDERSHSHERRRPRSKMRHQRHHSRSRTPSPVDLELERRMQRLAELERKEEEEAAREKFEEERIIEEAKKAKKKKEEEALKKLAIEEHNAKLLEEELKKKKEKEEADKIFKERVRSTFGAAGYDEESIEKILEKGETSKHGGSHKKIMDLRRPTYIKVHQKHLSPETLNIYELPWKWDEQNSNYIIIKRWIPEHDQEILFEHTRKIREGKLLTNTTVELQKEKDKLLLVRKKSPSRKRSPSRSYMFT